MSGRQNPSIPTTKCDVDFFVLPPRFIRMNLVFKIGLPSRNINLSFFGVFFQYPLFKKTVPFLTTLWAMDMGSRGSGRGAGAKFGRRDAVHLRG